MSIMGLGRIVPAEVGESGKLAKIQGGLAGSSKQLEQLVFFGGVSFQGFKNVQHCQPQGGRALGNTALVEMVADLLHFL